MEMLWQKLLQELSIFLTYGDYNISRERYCYSFEHTTIEVSV